jgi:hypothetical protein
VAQCGFAARFKTESGLARNIRRDGFNHTIWANVPPMTYPGLGRFSQMMHQTF